MNITKNSIAIDWSILNTYKIHDFILQKKKAEQVSATPEGRHDINSLLWKMVVKGGSIFSAFPFATVFQNNQLGPIDWSMFFLTETPQLILVKGMIELGSRHFFRVEIKEMDSGSNPEWMLKLLEMLLQNRMFTEYPSVTPKAICWSWGEHRP